MGYGDDVGHRVWHRTASDSSGTRQITVVAIQRPEQDTWDVVTSLPREVRQIGGGGVQTIGQVEGERNGNGILWTHHAVFDDERIRECRRLTEALWYVGRAFLDATQPTTEKDTHHV